MSAYDLAVVGGGPAGVAGALTAALLGLRVVLLDGNARLGGQYHRHALGERPKARFARQCEVLSARAEVRTRRQIWAVAAEDGAFTVHAKGEPPLLARRLLIATGAHDRPLPFPGWDLPGVLTAGGAQALLKGDGVVAGRRVAVAGTGPFLLPVAAGLARAGAHVVGVYEASSGLGLAGHPILALGKAGEAAGYALRLARHRVPYLTGHAVIAAHGGQEVTGVTVARLGRDWRARSAKRVACDTLAVGYGFVPQLDLAVQLGCATASDADGSPVVAVDARQRTSVPGVWAAGEPTGVGGSELAELEGRIAGLAAAGGADVPAVLLRRRARLRAFAAALHRAYPVRPGWTGWLREDTLVCRCEEVPLARVREAQRLGAADARSIKLLARPGMGWCQGRMCGYAVSCLSGQPQQAPRRPIAQPITLGELASPQKDS
ncbi:FAD/NAD(P)-binding oxidoreductase [Nonomuraea longicatena]|uniref:NAD(P)/FAD-dependent oxidoreductase n=1 Tax=Nonomuraea longicatena TaxID=83682 RepID=A0ABP3ZGS7_9ACTN